MHALGTVMEYAKDMVTNVGSATADFAKMIGGNTASLARRVGSGSAKLARNVGPRRGLIGLALVGVAVGGGIFLARYLRARAAEANKQDAEGTPKTKMSAAERRAQPAAQAMH